MLLSEADTRAKFIDPALKRAGWHEDLIRREVQVTQGRLYLVGNEAHRRQAQIADYVLYVDNVPLAVIEAKDESHHPGSGLQQAKKYAEMLDVRFAYSSNGREFVEFNYLTNTEKILPLAAFPSPDILTQRLKQQGAIPTAAGDPLFHPYDISLGLSPRYYQDVAVRRALKAIGDASLVFD